MKRDGNINGNEELEKIAAFGQYLYREERSANTIAKYCRDVRGFLIWAAEAPISRELVLSYKQQLIERYAAASVNSMLAAINHYLCWQGREDCRVKPLRIQRDLFVQREQELSEQEYIRLVQTARRQQNQKLALLLQTICATGIRVSELAYITVEAVRSGHTSVRCKGKQRMIFLPKKLCTILQQYIGQQGLKQGPVFCTRTGLPLDRSNIWRAMKDLSSQAGVIGGKVFPHNLRHLFARTYYQLEKDIVKLADLLGHSSINTTRIYTMETFDNHVRQMNRMQLVVSEI